ncbi:MAG: signal peptidase I [bacterium]
MDKNQIKKTKWQSFWELARFALIAIIIVVPIRIFIAQPFIVSGSSMVPTFQDGQYLVVDEISYILGTPKRDDVVVFKNPNNTKIFYIKRIIGLPGETVDVKSDTNEVLITNKEHPDGFNLDQSFIVNTGGIDGHMVLGENEYFVMGDNRPASSDSRYWGVVPKKLMIGRALLRLLPINKIDFMPGSINQAE